MAVVYTTAQRAVDRLVGLSILTQVGGRKRNRVYCAREIMDILDEPARLLPQEDAP